MNSVKHTEGGITVTFTLVFVVVISLIMVLLETALVYTGRSYYDLVAETATASLMGEYYLPLYDDYGILAVDLGFGGKYANVEQGEKLLEEYVDKNLESEGLGLRRVQKVRIEMKTGRITENCGEAFYKQVTEKLEYETGLTVLQKAEELLSLSGSTKQAAEILAKKGEAEQSVSVIDKCVLGLMESVDGIKITSGGKVKPQKSFVKRIVCGGITQEKSGINNDAVFEDIKEEYCDPLPMIKGLMEEESDSELKEKQKEFKRLIKETLSKVEEALALVETLKIKQAVCALEIEKYEAAVEAVEALLDTAFLSSIMNDLKVLKSYAGMASGDSSAIIDFVKMEKTLLKNRQCLKTVIVLLEEAERYFSKELSREEWSLRILEVGEELMQYDFEGLNFDYSNVYIAKEETNPFEFLKEFASEGVSALVFDGEMSERVLGTDALISNSFDAVKTDGSMFEGLSLDVLMDEVFTESLSKVADRFLFCGYLNGNFGNLHNSPDGSRVLLYELEYILGGHSIDSENLQNVISKIIALRTLINYVSIYCDSVKTGEAEAFATAIVGFTGVPLLVSATKATVLLIWAFEAALVETAGLLKGYSVPLLPDMSNYPVQFSEIFIMIKSRILSKSERYKSDKSVFGFNYEDYLNMFLLLQQKDEQTVRTMDLIQENIRLCYDDEFRFRNCMDAVKVVFNFRASPVFARLAFVEKSRQINGYEYKIVKNIAY